MTAEELGNLDDNYHRHELIKGVLLTMPPAKYEHGRVCANLTFLLMQYVKANRLGVVGTECGYKLESDPDTVLGPDVSFVAQDRISLSPEGYHSGPPDLAVEVLSPGDRRGKVEHKLSLWLEFGTRSVWLVNPRRRTVEVIGSTGEEEGFCTKLTNSSTTLVPGFHVKVSEIFS